VSHASRIDAASSYQTTAAPALRSPTPATTTAARAVTRKTTTTSRARRDTRRGPPVLVPIRESAVRASSTARYRPASSRAWSISSRPDATSAANSSYTSLLTPSKADWLAQFTAMSMPLKPASSSRSKRFAAS